MRLDTIDVMCETCNHKFKAVRSTKNCPKCGAEFNEGVVEAEFARQETLFANRGTRNIEKGINATGNAMKQTGNILSGCGGVLMWLLVFLFVLSMCGGLAGL